MRSLTNYHLRGLARVGSRAGLDKSSLLSVVLMLSCFSKVIEKASIEQLVEYTNKEIPNDNQFAFKQQNSCLHPILLTRHLIETELEKGKD